MSRGVKDFDKPGFSPKFLPQKRREDSDITKSSIFFDNDLSLITLGWVKINQEFFSTLGKPRSKVSTGRIKRNLKKILFLNSTKPVCHCEQKYFFFYYCRLMSRGVKDFDKPGFSPKFLPPKLSEDSDITKSNIFFSHDLSLITLGWVKINQEFFSILGKTRSNVSTGRIKRNLKKICF